jgi:hypothetical protein
MAKVKLEFTLRQATEIFTMMDEGSILHIENRELENDHASVRVCHNAIDSFQKQISKLLREDQERINAKNK